MQPARGLSAQPSTRRCGWPEFVERFAPILAPMMCVRAIVPYRFFVALSDLTPRSDESIHLAVNSQGDLAILAGRFARSEPGLRPCLVPRSGGVAVDGVPAARPVLIHVADMNVPAAVGSLDGIQPSLLPVVRGTQAARPRGRLIHRPGRDH